MVKQVKTVVPVLVSKETMAWARRYFNPDPAHNVIGSLAQLCEDAINDVMARNPVEGYVGDYWGVNIERRGSLCNVCGTEFEPGEFVTAQHYRRPGGSHATHYFHPHHVPAPNTIRVGTASR